VKSVLCENQNVVLKKSNYSNPNTFNAFDAALAFSVFCVAFLLLRFISPSLIKALLAFFGDATFANCVAVLISQSIVLLVALVFSKVKKVGLLSGGGFAFKFDAQNALFGLITAVGVFFLLYRTHMSFVDDWTHILYLTDYETHALLKNSYAGGANPFLTIIFTFVLVPFLPAVCEEALFRGVIMRGLRQFGDAFAIICSALIFALMHGSYEQFVLQFATGAVIAIAVTITDNFFVGSAIHFAYNFIASLLIATPEVLNSFVPQYAYLFNASSIILGFAFVLAGFVYFGKLFLDKYKRKVTDKPTKANYKVFYVIESDFVAENKYNARYYNSVTDDFYDKKSNEKFYDGNRFVKFNKRSDKLISLIFLGLSIALSIALIILNG